MSPLNKEHRSQAMYNNFINLYGGNKNKHMNNLYGFLHRHPQKEAEANLDKNHVIIDKDEWETILSYFEENTKDYDICKELFTTLKAMDATRCDRDIPE
jgi:hypothetical protein